MITKYIETVEIQLRVHFSLLIIIYTFNFTILGNELSKSYKIKENKTRVGKSDSMHSKQSKSSA